MLGGEGNENGEKTTIGLISKKQLCTCSPLCLIQFFAFIFLDYNVKLRVGSIGKSNAKSENEFHLREIQIRIFWISFLLFY